MSDTESEAFSALAHLTEAAEVTRRAESCDQMEKAGTTKQTTPNSMSPGLEACGDACHGKRVDDALPEDGGCSDKVKRGDNNVTKDHDGSKQAKRGRRVKDECKFPVEPRVIAVIKKPRTYMNHSYRDFSSVPPELSYEEPSDVASMTFSQKVHHILSQDEYTKWISWMPHGRAFRIHIPKLFEQKVSPKYFGHSRYSSFLRQLNNYGFKHITQGQDRNCYYHEFMLRELPHLSKYMPKPKDARRLIQDPENEPDFYQISKKYPLPDDPSYAKDKVANVEEITPPEASKVSTTATSVAVPSTSTALKRHTSDLNWMNTSLPDARRIRGNATDPLLSLAASAGLTSGTSALAGVTWPIQATTMPNLQAALDQSAVLAALTGYSAVPRTATLSDLYPSVNSAQHAQNLFDALRHL